MIEIIIALIATLGAVAIVQTIAKTIVSWRLAKLAIENEDKRKRDGFADWPVEIDPPGVNGNEPHRSRRH